MYSINNFYFLMLSAVVMIFAISCSNSGSPVVPSADDSHGDIDELLVSEVVDNHNRTPMAVYEAMIDPEAETFTVTPVTRDAQYHFALTNLYPDCLRIEQFGFTPDFWADINLVHPLPGSGIDAFDPRVIAILPANAGVRFIYPTLYVGGNNRVVLEPDGYTKLFNDLAPGIFGNVNPFIAYFTDVTYRRWSSTAQTEEIRRWRMDLDGFGGRMHFLLVVDVSTNFPAPPVPVTDNAPEPIAISAEVSEGIYDEGGTAEIEVTLFDWQGHETIGGVLVESPALFNDVVSLEYSKPGSNPNEYIFEGTISNEKLAPSGEYSYLVAAWDRDTGIHIYKEFSLFVPTVPTDGNLIWAKRAGGLLPCVGSSITTLSNQSTVVTGAFEGEVIFGLGEPNETKLISEGEMDILVARYNPDGTLEWAKSAGSSDNCRGFSVTTLSDHSTVVTGFFNDKATFGEGESNETTLTSAGDEDFFMARYYRGGTLAWAKRAGGANDVVGRDITTLSDDSIVVAGRFGGTAIFGEGEPNETILTNSSTFYSDIFIARYNSDGMLEWAKSAGGSQLDNANAITTLSDNSTVMTGIISGTATFGPGEPNETILTSGGSEADIFMARYNPEGTLAWAVRAGGEEWCSGSGITALLDDSTIVTGTFRDTAIFGEDEPNETTLTTDGIGDDSFIARYNTDGTLEWAKSAGGTATCRARDITVLSDNSTVITGYFRETAIFGPGEPNETSLVSAGNSDIFIARYNIDGSLAWAKSVRGSDSNFSYGITTLSDDSTVVTGTIRSEVVFGSGEPNETILTSDGDRDMYIARFEP